MKEYRLFFRIALLAFTVLSVEVMVEGQERGYIKGSILDVRGSRVPNAVVTAECSSEKYVVTASSIGEYSFDLPVEVCSLSASAERLGFAKTYRSAISVRPKTSTSISFVVFGAQTALSKYPDRTSHTPEDLPAVSYSYDKIAGVSSSGVRDAMIRYAIKVTTDARTRFLSSSVPESLELRAGIEFSYDDLTIVADEAILDIATKEITASGNVVVEKNGIKSMSERVRVKIVNGEPIVTKIK